MFAGYTLLRNQNTSKLAQIMLLKASRSAGVLAGCGAGVSPTRTTKGNYLRTATGSRTPASVASLAALSVASQVKSGSLRPKCPYAAVFLKIGRRSFRDSIIPFGVKEK